MEDEIGRILSPFTVVDAVVPISVAIGLVEWGVLPIRQGSTTVQIACLGKFR